MNWLYNLKTARKLALGFGLCLTLAVLVGIVSITRMAQMTKISENIVSNSLAEVAHLGTFQANARQFRTVEYRHVLTAAPADKTKAEDDIAKAETGADKALTEFQAAATDPASAGNFNDLQAEWQKYAAMKDALLDLSRKNDISHCAAQLNGPMKLQFHRLTDVIDRVTAENNAHAQDYSHQAQAAYSAARALIIGLLVLATLIGTLAAVLITRYMTGALTQVSERLETLNTICVTNLGTAVEAMERGDLTAKIATGTEPLDIQTKDEFGRMAATFNAMLNRMKSTIGSFRTSQAALADLVGQMQDSAAQVTGAAEALAGTSQQIGAVTEEIGATMIEVAQASEQSARGASEIAQGSASQAASVADGAERVKGLAAAVQGVAREAKAAGQAAGQATQTARDGAQAVEQTVAGMQRIQAAVSQSAQVIGSLGQTSTQIGGIVNTIDEIAAQTNLLALNAAIEAARAGDAGRGFAVVADEVRKLAERCTTATKDIGALISEIQRQTGQAVTAMETGTREAVAGTALAGDAGDALERISAVVEEMSDRVLRISAASEEMSVSAQGVTQAISEVAAVIEESSAAAEEMSASSEQVSDSVATVAETTAQQEAVVAGLVGSAGDLAGVALTLSALVERFEVDDTERRNGADKVHSARPILTLHKAA